MASPKYFARAAHRSLVTLAWLLTFATPAIAQTTPTAGQNRSAASPQALALPQLQSSVRGLSDAPSASLTTGGASYAVPFLLPPGRGTITPSLALTYASGGGQGVAGLGFHVGIAAISRDTSDGVPRYVEGPLYHVQEDRFSYEGSELVPVDSAAMTAVDGAAVPAELSGYQQYRARIEGKFMRFFRAPDGLRWVVQSPDGGRYDFGPIANGPPELVAPELLARTTQAGEDLRGSAASLSATNGRIFQWALTRASDAHGSTVYYQYSQHEGALYLSDVYYVSPQTCAGSPSSALYCAAPLSSYGVRVHLVYEARPDPFTSYRSGFRVRTALRLRRVEMTSAAETVGQRYLVRRYHLRYDARSYHSLLRSVQLEGRPESPDAGLRAQVGHSDVPESSLTDSVVGVLLPPLTFGYTGDAQLETGSFGFPALDANLHRSTSSPNVGIQDPRADLFDVNRDGLPDLMVTDPKLHRTAEGGPAIGVYFNGFAGAETVPARAGGFSLPVPTAVPSADADTLRFSTPNLLAFEVDGDGGSDFLFMPKRASYDYFVVSRAADAGSARPSAQGYRWLRVPVAIPPGGIDPAIDLSDAQRIRMLDVNGDGLVDLVRTGSDRLETWLNLGNQRGGDGRFGSVEYQAGVAQLTTKPIVRCLPATPGTPLSFADPAVLVADLNGDGLPDLARLTTSRLVYWPSRGNGYFGTGDSRCPSGLQGDIHVEVQTPPNYPVGSERKLVLGDMDADGLSDLLLLGDGTLSVWFNRGGESFTGRVVLRGAPRMRNVEEYVRLVDIDGSGTTDVLFARSGDWTWMDPAGGTRPRLLSSVENGLGASVSVEYQSSVHDYLRDLAQLDACADECEGFGWSHVDASCDAHIEALTGECARAPSGTPLLPAVVRAITTRDGFERLGREGSTTRIEYAYHDPYYDGLTREFRGFSVGDTTTVGDALHPTSTLRSHMFIAARPQRIARDRHADNPYDPLAGLTYLTETFASDGTYLGSAHTGFAVRTLTVGLDGRAISFAYPRRRDEVLYDTVQFVPAPAGSIVDDPVEGGQGLEALRFERVVGPGVQSDPRWPSERQTMRLRGGKYAHLVSFSDEVDNVGHVHASHALGRVHGEHGEAASDEHITTRSEWALQGDSSRWMWRLTRSWIEGSSDGRRLQETEREYDAEGDLRLTRYRLDAASPYKFAGDEDGALGFVPKLEHPIVSILDDSWGQVVASCDGGDVRSGSTDGCLRYSEVAYEQAYGQLPVAKSLALGRTPGGLTLTTTEVVAFDRAYAIATRIREPNGSLSEGGVDGLGRPTWFRLPAGGACAGSTVPNTHIRYATTSDASAMPVSVIETTEERACTFGADSLVTRDFLDGLGRSRATLVSAATPHVWERSGLATFDAKASVARAYQPDFLDVDDPSPAVALALPNTPSETFSYDAFGRERCTRHADGESLTCTSYHALSEDTCDPNDHQQGTPDYRTCTTERRDGHGRVHDKIIRNVGPNGETEVYRLFTDYRADSVTTRITRAQTTNDAPRELSLAVQGRTLSRTFTHDSLGRLLASTDRDTDARRAGVTPYDSTHRYLYNRISDLVAVRDPRGCGLNSFRDMSGRVLGEQYVGCEGADRPELPTESIPAGAIAVDVTSAPLLVDVRNYYDAYPAWAVGELTPPAGSAGVMGRVTAVVDPAQRTVHAYDARGNAVWSARQVALISTAEPAPTTSTAVPRRSAECATQRVSYDEAHTYVLELEHDFANRPHKARYPAHVDFEGPGAPPTITGEIRYDVRGAPRASYVGIDGVLQPVIADTIYTADGLNEQITYGDGAHGRSPTVSTATYDARRRPLRVQALRAPTATGTADRTLAEVTHVFDQSYAWDPASNLTVIRDERPAVEHPEGFRPQSVTIRRDALYRVTDVEYAYHADNGLTLSDPAQDWREVAADLRNVDPMASVPAPSAAAASPNRVVSMTWTHDWLGTVVDWDDDASAFHERSLGAITNGSAEPNGRPSALRFATNLPQATPTPSSTERGGYVEVTYGEGGNVEAVTVHGQCRDAGSELCWDDASKLPAERAATLAVRCACAVEQHYQYGWDELNRISEARRYDRSGGSFELAARLRYRYDANNQRIVKQVLSDDDVRVALYVFPGDFERRGLVQSSEGTYEAQPGDSESQYLVGGARVVYQRPLAGTTLDSDYRMTVEVGDVLGTTSAVLDLRSGELLELSTYYPNGGRESLRVSDQAAVPLEPDGFTGKEADAEVGLTYFGERYLLPYLGRWASPDPLQLHDVGGGEPLNNYHYVSGHVLQSRDPIGLDEANDLFDAMYPKDENGTRWEVDSRNNVWVLEDGATEWRLLSTESNGYVINDSRVAFDKRVQWARTSCSESSYCSSNDPWYSGRESYLHVLSWGYDKGWITLDELEREDKRLADIRRAESKAMRRKAEIDQYNNWVNSGEERLMKMQLGVIQAPLMGAMGGWVATTGMVYDVTATGVSCANGDAVNCGIGLIGMGTAYALRERSPSIKHVNSGPGPNRTQNCANCAIATDATLAGNPASALPGGPTPITAISTYYNRSWLLTTGPKGIRTIMQGWGPGARAIVFGGRGAGQVGHVFNVMNQRGKIRFFDGQIGRAAQVNGYVDYYILRTN